MNRKYGLMLGAALFLGFLLFVGLMPNLLTLLYIKEVEVLYPGDHFVLETKGTVDVLAYSSGATEPSSLLNMDGEIVLTTQPETIPGNFAVKGTLNEGVYTLDGEQTTFRFSGENFVKVENPRIRKINQYTGLFAWGLFTLAMTSLIVALDREDKLLKSSLGVSNG